MNVLSLFDGISCGRVALERAGIRVDKYYASEIDKYAIQIALKNYPDTVQLGDVREWKNWNIEWSRIDLLIGGSPCTDLSIAGKRKGLSGEKSRLFYDYVDILNHIRKLNPNLKFLLENVESMPVSDRNIINRCLGVNPIMINSSLVSAQNRKRYYWFNWGLKTTKLFGLPTCSIPQPEDKHILLKDILETGIANMEENIASCVSDCKGMEHDSTNRPAIQHHQSHPSACEYGLTEETDIVSTDNPIRQAVCLKSERTEEGKRLRKDYESGKIHHGFNEHRILAPRTDNKTNTLTTAEKDNLICEPLEYFACRRVGRKLDEEGRRKDYSDAKTVQIIEINLDPNKVNALTTVAKDNLVCELLPHNEPITEGNIIINNNVTEKSEEITKKDERVSAEIFDETTKKRNKWMNNGKNNSRNSSQGCHIYSVRNKAVSLNVNDGGIGGKPELHRINLPDGEYIIRKLTLIECERLQTLPDNYTKYGNDGNRITMIPRSARYKALGNGWTVDVIAYIFKFLTEEQDKMKGLRVLSLFDGISCGRLALHRAGIPIDKYYASEIDKYATKVTMANFPDTIQLGDVRKIDFKQFTGKIDLLIGGSPCQDLSLSGKRAGLQGERSGLFYKFVEALNTVKPRYFLLENNVGMPMDAYEEISRLMGCYPVEINSALVSAQSRRRYYWTNIRLRKARLFGLPHSDIPQPKDKGIILQDVLENGTAFRTKSIGLCTVDYKVAKTRNMLDRWTRHQESPVKAVRSDEATDSNGRTAEGYRVYHVRNGYADLWEDSSPQSVSRFGETVNIGYIGTGHRQGYNIYSEKGKSATLMASGGGLSPCGQGVYKIDLPDGNYVIRSLTPLECEGLQTLPDNYTDKGISMTQRYKCIGNGWTVDVIAHIFSFLKSTI